MTADVYAQRVFKQAGIFVDVTETDDSDVNSMPQDGDSTYMLTRLYSGAYLNCARPLEYNLVLRAVMRNSGDSDDDDTNDDNDASDTVNITFPSPKSLFDIVWKLIPDFLQDKIRQWALASTPMEAQIAREITEYVKTALGLLPIPVPAIFINAVANLVVPPLVTYIVSWIKNNTVSDADNTAQAFGIGYKATSQSRRILKQLDRMVLRSAGLKAMHLPSHLAIEVNVAVSNDDGYNSFGQPNGPEAMLDMQEFYDGDFRNGCKPMPIAQIIAAQIRTNPKSDEDPLKLGPKAWKKLTDDQKTQLKKWAATTPPDEADIAQAMYDPVYTVLGEDPYDVPQPIRAAFTAMKVPEVTAWVVDTYGN